MHPCKYSCCGGTQQNVYNSFWSMAGFRSPCSQFTSWINMTCLEGVLCSSISAFLCFSHSHHGSCILSIVSPDPHLQRPRSRRWSEAWQTCKVENTAVTRCPLCAPVTLMTDTHRSPPLYCAPLSLLSALWGSELNADNMSSSVHLTLPVGVLAISSILMQFTPFISPYKKTSGVQRGHVCDRSWVSVISAGQGELYQ